MCVCAALASVVLMINTADSVQTGHFSGTLLDDSANTHTHTHTVSVYWVVPLCVLYARSHPRSHIRYTRPVLHDETGREVSHLVSRQRVMSQPRGATRRGPCCFVNILKVQLE